MDRSIRQTEPQYITPSSQKNLVAALTDLLAWLGCPAVERLKTSKLVRFPKNINDGAIDSLSEDELARLRSAADSMPSYNGSEESDDAQGWRGDVARFLVSALATTGIRPQEIRVQEIADVGLVHGYIRVSHPKGEGRYAKPRDVPMSEQTRVSRVLGHASTATTEKYYGRVRSERASAGFVRAMDKVQVKVVRRET